MTTVHPEGYSGASDSQEPPRLDSSNSTDGTPFEAALAGPINTPGQHPTVYDVNTKDSFPVNRESPSNITLTDEELLIASLRRGASPVIAPEQEKEQRRGVSRRTLFGGIGAALVAAAGIVTVVEVLDDKGSSNTQKPGTATTAGAGGNPQNSGGGTPSPEVSDTPVDDYPSVPAEHAVPVQQGPLGVGSRTYPGNPGFRRPNNQAPMLNGKPIDLPVLYPPSLNYQGGGLDGDIIQYHGHAYRPDETAAMVLKYISALMSLPLDSPDRQDIMKAFTNSPDVANYINGRQAAFQKLYDPGDTMVIYDSADAPAGFGWLPNRYLQNRDVNSPAKSIHMDDDGGHLYFRGLSPNWETANNDPWPDQRGYAAIVEESGSINPDPKDNFFFEYEVIGSDGKPGALFGTMRITEIRFLLADRTGQLLG